MELKDYQARALAENQAFEAKARASNDAVSPELEDKMNRHTTKDSFCDEALSVRLPQFFIRVPNGGFFESDQPFQLFEREVAYVRKIKQKITTLANAHALKTKGCDRDNTDSELKLKLGKLWQAKAGHGFHYMMVFDNNPIDGAERLADALKKIARL